MKTQHFRDLLHESLVTLRHARTFVTSREKMHETGVELYDQLVKDIEFALGSPSSELETPVKQKRSDGTTYANGDKRPDYEPKIKGDQT